MTEIKIVIKNGKAHIEVLGAVGASCEDATRILEAALGKVENKGYKPEYFVELDGVHQNVNRN